MACLQVLRMRRDRRWHRQLGDARFALRVPLRLVAPAVSEWGSTQWWGVDACRVHEKSCVEAGLCGPRRSGRRSTW